MARRLLIALLLAACVIAPAGAATERGLFWRVETGDGEPVGWLLGSIHVGRSDLYPLPDTVQRAIGATDTLVVELDILGASAADAAAATWRLGMLEPGDALRQRLPRPLWEDTRRLAERHGIPAMLLERQRPWFAAMTLTMKRLEAAGWSAAWGIEAQLLQRLRDSHEVIELESVAEQMTVLAGIPESEQIALLEQVVREGDALTDDMAEMVNAWRAGDTERLHRLVQASMADGMPITGRRLIGERNARMSDRLRALFRDGRQHLVVVGSAHLTGADSIIAHLERAGYRITRQGAAKP